MNCIVHLARAIEGMLMWNVLFHRQVPPGGIHVNAAREEVCPRSQEVQANFEGALLAKLSAQE